ncbi:hypothetical protein [Nonomuraea sp. NPDC002799]
MSRPSRRACAATAAFAAALAVIAVPAGAASAAPPVARLTLYSDTAFSRPTNSVTYPACDAFIGRIPGLRTGSFDNSPLPGCQVVLHALSGDYVLCAGRAVVPAAFRQAVLYSIRTGASVPCPV